MLIEDTAKHEDVARVLSVHDDRSMRRRCNIGSQVRDASLHPWRYHLFLDEPIQELVGQLDPAINDLYARASAASSQHQMEDALAQAAPDVKEVAGTVELDGLDR